MYLSLLQTRIGESFKMRDGHSSRIFPSPNHSCMVHLPSSTYISVSPKHRLVGGFNPFEKYARQLGLWYSQLNGKIRFMFQTTNQMSLLISSSSHTYHHFCPRCCVSNCCTKASWVWYDEKTPWKSAIRTIFCAIPNGWMDRWSCWIFSGWFMEISSKMGWW